MQRTGSTIEGSDNVFQQALPVDVSLAVLEPIKERSNVLRHDLFYARG
jgi:hypothetical protein